MKYDAMMKVDLKVAITIQDCKTPKNIAGLVFVANP